MKTLKEDTTKVICEEKEEDTKGTSKIPISLRNNVSTVMHALHSVKFLSRRKPKRRNDVERGAEVRGTIFQRVSLFRA